jgi:hypothetical protein
VLYNVHWDLSDLNCLVFVLAVSIIFTMKTSACRIVQSVITQIKTMFVHNVHLLVHHVVMLINVQVAHLHIICMNHSV